ncbi:hypothetical protein CRM22_009324 [Opisthorchis felineus]|uniref:Solute carrier family 25 member 38 homolog n=1 Tax=Opisthorchis felineus TaxID=147828 RepID=A0A4S2L843_OPIFE|nr:hypothetical protein CRM22_009324 [Opisthorchis felineus]
MGERDKSVKSAFQAGCISGVISTIAFQPLDVIRTRLQAQMLSGNKNPGLRAVFRSVYHGTAQAGLSSPYNTSLTIGLPRFWTGTVASLWRCVPGIGGYFFFLSMLENLVRRYKGVLTGRLGGLQCVQNFLTGFCARSFVAVALSPFLVAKTQIESGRFVDKSLWGTLCRVHRSASWRGLYSGVLATIARDGPYSGLYFMTYSHVKGKLLHKSDDDALPLPLLAFCAGISAFVATGMTQPADVLRAQRQLMLFPVNAPTQSKAVYRVPSWSQVFRNVCEVDGLTGFWRGFTLRLMRRTGLAMVSWCLYERMSS